MTAQALTRSGRIEGVAARGVLHFKGIPYARPPRGPLRFRPPEPAEPWEGVRPARAFGPSAPQGPAAPRLTRLIVGGAGASQDCLYLNVWTPALRPGRRPVMVWIHGGGFVMGSGSSLLYSGSRLALRGDVVVVTFNYRLGAVGFLGATALERGAHVPPANLGLRDQIALLEWVRDNIEEFGGDPENVTIFGESAGAMSGAALLAVPRARGLFHRAILQSGAAHNCSTPEQARETTAHFLRELRLERADVEALGRLPMSELVRAQMATFRAYATLQGTLPFQPCIDGELLPEPPLDAIARGAGAPVPLLIGTNADEWRLFTFNLPGRFDLSLAELRRRIALCVPSFAVESALHAYAPKDAMAGRSTRAECWSSFQGDRIFHVPAERLADAHAKTGAPTYRYLFRYAPRLLRKRLGACHGMEIPFVFGTLRSRWLAAVLGSSATARKLSEGMMDAWCEFARSGEVAVPAFPDWRPYALPERSTFELRGRAQGREDPFAEAREFWKRVPLR